MNNLSLANILNNRREKTQTLRVLVALGLGGVLLAACGDDSAGSADGAIQPSDDAVAAAPDQTATQDTELVYQGDNPCERMDAEVELPGIGLQLLLDAATDGQLVVVCAIIAEAGEMDIDGRDHTGATAFYMASADGYLDVARALLAAGADPNAVDATGWTPLHAAAMFGHGDVVDQLIEVGAAVDARDAIGWTPLHRASMNGQLHVLASLLAAGAEIDTLANDGATPLHAASWNGRTGVVVELLARGVDANIQDEDGLTALHEASRAGHAGVVKALLGAGANPALANTDGATAVELAVNPQVEQLFAQ